MKAFQPRLDALPPAQRAFWPKLRDVPKHFVLYGGTALALRLRHRQSIDFDFFTAIPFEPESLHRDLGFAAGAEVLRKSQNTLSLITPGTPGVRISFFGGLTFGHVEPADPCSDNGVCVAGLKDLMATKLNTVYQRAEAKDYLDIDALIRAGCSLVVGLACARAVYRTSFNAMLPLKALTFFEDGDLPSLPDEVKRRLAHAVSTLGDIPQVRARSDRISQA
jgi:Nucleotidyl transferase AbiEii toxin, Type IV TA system